MGYGISNAPHWRGKSCRSCSLGDHLNGYSSGRRPTVSRNNRLLCTTDACVRRIDMGGKDQQINADLRRKHTDFLSSLSRRVELILAVVRVIDEQFAAGLKAAGSPGGF